MSLPENEELQNNNDLTGKQVDSYPEAESPEQSDEEAGQFRSGFLYGIFSTIMVLLAAYAGWYLAAHGIPFITKDHSQTEADILTDKATLKKLDQVADLINKNYLGDLDSEQLEAYLFKGIAAGLDDPYAAYFSADEYQDAKNQNKGSYFGIGISVSYNDENGEFTVEEVYEDSVAAQAGIQEQDKLVRVNEQDLAGMTLSEVVELIQGQKDDFVLAVYRPSQDEEVEFTIECSDVELTYVSCELLDDGIGYICLSQFTENAVKQFENALNELQEQGATSLLVDLRDNPGGLLTSVCDILDLLLPKELIVYTVDRAGERQDYYSKDERAVDMTVNVLVNENSASASEIFSGAIQDLGYGTIYGSQTYGKGVVQKTFTFSDGSAIKFTVENYYTPNGQNINGNGITPDVEITADESENRENAGDAVLEKTLELIRSQ